MAPIRLLFVCTGNSACSQMAEESAPAYGNGRVQVFSAGTEPKGVNPCAIEVMPEKGIYLSQQESKAFSEDLARRMHYVIPVCGDADERCAVLPIDVKRLHWLFEGPAKAQASAAAVR
jgi:arsenate reductase